MSSDKDKHLEENQIVRAVIDTSDLPNSLQVHLAQCSQCQMHKQRFEQELTHLGQMAARFAPEPRKKVSVPELKSRAAFWGFLNWRFAFGAAATVATMLVVFWGTLLIWSPQQGGIGDLAQDMIEAERLMTEINMLVENALPEVYLNIVGETGLSIDEEFMQFLIPSVENDPLISDSGKKGSILC